ncbi:probable RNA-binding protein 18 isoform X1 [Ischnura elegans]|uniref:probable RNA-binding protein 18 isoform X1 n=1 Tax=Ischnura elegans TaxID=197161 RepID=UPI001ED8BF68|nr:probable RNA-binding protein 18 isoform X1 [Ischnura elegans]
MSGVEPLQKPLPLEPLPEKALEERRLWIGNLDSRITEYQLLKLLQKYGPIEKFDLLFHRSGPLVGLPRGYAFVTFESNEDATRAKVALDGKLVGCKRIVLRWAHSISREDLERPKPQLEIPALAGTKNEKKVSRLSVIQAIEAKLKMMERGSTEDFELNAGPSRGLPLNPALSTASTRPRGSMKHHHDSRPYNRAYNRR